MPLLNHTSEAIFRLLFPPLRLVQASDEDFFTVNLWDECQTEYFSPKLPSSKIDFCCEDENFKNEEHIPQKPDLHFNLWLRPLWRSQVPFKDTGLED